MKMIYIKTAPVETQWRFAERLNPNMEIQLLGDFMSNETIIDTCLSFIKDTGAEIEVIHTPLFDGEDTDLKDYREPKTFRVIEKVSRLANTLGRHLGRRMPVVIHCGETIEQFRLDSTCLLEEFGQLISQYPMVNYYIEHPTTLTVHKGSVQGIRDARPTTVPEVVHWLRSELKAPDRFYSVLDTCHALMTVRLYNTIGADCTLEDFFKAHEGICGLIHLTNCRDYGYGEDHGTPFTEDDRELVSEIFTLYSRYQFNCPLTLEVKETDYTKYDNYLITLEQIKPYLV